jgi:hypothetical protein
MVGGAPPDDQGVEDNDSEQEPEQPKPQKMTAMQKKYLGMILKADQDNDNDTGVVVKVNKKTVHVRWTEVFDDDQEDPYLQTDFPISEIKQYEKEYGVTKGSAM